MALDNAKNFAKVTVSIGYDASATSIVLSSGHGAKLPTVAFNAVWWNVTDYADPSDDPNVEIVRVTAISTDTLTVTRAQEGISASTKNTAGKTYKMIAGLTAKAINSDIAPVASPSFTGTVSVASAITQAGSANHIVITPGASKLVKIAVLEQDITANNYRNNAVILTGWGYKDLGASPAAGGNITITWGITFATAPVVVSSYFASLGSVPTAIGDMNYGPDDEQKTVTCAVRNITTTQGVMGVRWQAAPTSNVRYTGFAWIAIGTL